MCTQNDVIIKKRLKRHPYWWILVALTVRTHSNDVLVFTREHQNENVTKYYTGFIRCDQINLLNTIVWCLYLYVCGRFVVSLATRAIHSTILISVSIFWWKVSQRGLISYDKKSNSAEKYLTGFISINFMRFLVSFLLSMLWSGISNTD